MLVLLAGRNKYALLAFNSVKNYHIVFLKDPAWPTKDPAWVTACMRQSILNFMVVFTQVFVVYLFENKSYSLSLSIVLFHFTSSFSKIKFDPPQQGKNALVFIF